MDLALKQSDANVQSSPPWLLPGKCVCGGHGQYTWWGALQEDFLEETIIELAVMRRGFELFR